MISAKQQLKERLSQTPRKLSLESPQDLLNLAFPADEQTVHYVDVLLQVLRVELLTACGEAAKSKDIPTIRENYQKLSRKQKVAVDRYDEVKNWLELHAPHIITY